MLLKQQFKQQQICREAEAFHATCVIFKIKTLELAVASGLDRNAIERFKVGEDDITTTTLFKILKVLTPKERAFYNSLMQIQGAASDANVTLPLLDLSPEIKIDAFRDALDLTLRVFCIQQKEVYTAAGMQGSNFSAWFTGRRDMNLTNLARVKGALSNQQRIFFEAVADIFIAQEASPPMDMDVSGSHINAA